MGFRILQGNVFDVLPTIEPGSIDCVTTSPPYWQLRAYLPKGHALKPLELGSEPTPAAFVANMVKVFALVRDCLADHGTVWLNMGDTYGGGGQSRPQGGLAAASERADGKKRNAECWANMNGEVEYAARSSGGLDAGNLCLIPQRLAIALQDDGWLVRSVIVWHKPAPMPASVSGWSWRRCRMKVKEGGRGGNGHKRMMESANDLGGYSCDTAPRAEWSDCPGCPKCEPHGGLVLRRGSWRPTSSWEPVLMLAKSARYYCDGEAVKTPLTEHTIKQAITDAKRGPSGPFAPGTKGWHTMPNPDPSGANLRDVWRADMSRADMLAELAKLPEDELRDLLFPPDGNAQDLLTIAAEPLKAKHYAAYPTELVYRCLAAGTSSRGYCPACGAAWARVVDVEQEAKCRNAAPDKYEGGRDERGGSWTATYAEQTRAISKTLGWRPTCRCGPHEPRPGRVLDPFCGSGRTGVQALRMGLEFVGVELNPEYVALAREMMEQESPLFNQES